MGVSMTTVALLVEWLKELFSRLDAIIYKNDIIME